jgi:predicted DsbA family dithiol-disulfide isomerase
MMKPIIIDVYADIVCPWCYIGFKRLEKALEAHELVVLRRWQPFQLRPEAPPQGQDWQSFAKQKFGGVAHAQAAFTHVTSLGEEEGVAFRFDRVASAPNTVDAHRLILLAREHGKEWEMAEALFRSYFTEGRNLNTIEHLLEIAQGVGLEGDIVPPYLQGNTGIEAVLESQRVAQHYRINGVPFYIISNEGGERYGVSGAQPPQRFLEIFAKLVLQL